MGYTEDTAQDIAMQALAEAAASGDPKIVDQIGEMMAASSQSLQEAYLTAIRVRRAEARAREMLAAAAAKRAGAPPAPVAATPAETAPQPDSTPDKKPAKKGW